MLIKKILLYKNITFPINKRNLYSVNVHRNGNNFKVTLGDTEKFPSKDLPLTIANVQMHIYCKLIGQASIVFYSPQEDIVGLNLS